MFKFTFKISKILVRITTLEETKVMFIDKDFTLNDYADVLADNIQYNIAEIYIRNPDVNEQVCIIIRKGYSNYGNVLKHGANIHHYIKSKFHNNGSISLGSWSDGVKVKVTLLCHN